MNKAGFTLIEVLIGGALALAVSIVLLNVVISLFRLSARSGTRDGLQGRAVILLGRIHSDASRASLPSLAVEPHGMVLTRLKTLTGTGQRVWEEKSLAYFWERGAKKLWYRETPPIPTGLSYEFSPSRPPHFTERDLTTLLAPEEGVTVSLGESITKFNLALEGKQLRIALALEGRAHQNRVETFELTRLVQIRN